jgi:hypothetical protein
MFLKKEEIHSIILPNTRLPGIGLIQRLFRIHPCHFQFAISTGHDNRKGLNTPPSITNPELNGYKDFKKVRGFLYLCANTLDCSHPFCSSEIDIATNWTQQIGFDSDRSVTEISFKRIGFRIQFQPFVRLVSVRVGNVYRAR